MPIPSLNWRKNVPRHLALFNAFEYSEYVIENISFDNLQVVWFEIGPSFGFGEALVSRIAEELGHPDDPDKTRSLNHALRYDMMSRVKPSDQMTGRSYDELDAMTVPPTWHEDIMYIVHDILRSAKDEKWFP